MWQVEVSVDLDAIRANVALLRSICSPSNAQVMVAVKADAYGHGLVPVARAAVEAGAAWLGVATLDEALQLRAAGLTAPVLAWLHAPGMPLFAGVEADVDLSVSSLAGLDAVVAAAARAGRPARVHLKIDTGLSRNGAAEADWPELVEAAAKAESDGSLTVVGVWSHLACADEPGHPSIDRQLAAYHRALEAATAVGLAPPVRHLANSAATLTRPDTHFDLVRVGIAAYGLSPVPGVDPGLRPAMTVRARVALVKRVPEGEGVSYGHTYITPAETTLALVPIGYGDGVPRAASSRAPVHLAGRVRTIAGRVAMDQFVLDCGDDEVAPGDVAVLFGPGDAGEPTADDWAAACDTLNYEIVTRMGSARTRRTYHGERPW
jgi:alanine racemase